MVPVREVGSLIRRPVSNHRPATLATAGPALENRVIAFLLLLYGIATIFIYLRSFNIALLIWTANGAVTNAIIETDSAQH